MTTPRSERRERLAILGVRVLRISNLDGWLGRLAARWNVTVYCEDHDAPHDARFDVRSVPRWPVPPPVRAALFGLLVLVGLVRRRARVLYAHSTVPAGLTAVLAGKLLRIPVVVGLDAGEGVALPDIGFGTQLRARRTRINRFVLGRADSVCTLTEFHARLVRENLCVPAARIHVIPRGVEVARFAFEERPIGRPVRLLHVGYLHPVKDQETLLRCFALLRARIPCTLTIVGEDYWGGRVQALSEALSVRGDVTFTGAVPYEHMPGLYAGADVLLHTSRYESMAMVVVEALASGLLVCGTAVGILADLDGRCCLTAPPRDHARLAEVVGALLDRPEEIERLRRDGRRWVEAHDLEWSVRRLEQVLDDVG